MDGFDDAFGESPVEAVGKSNGNGLMDDEGDPAAEFLAREQSNFAGLEDEIPSVPLTAENGETSNGGGEDLDFGFGGNGIDEGTVIQAFPVSEDRSESPPISVFTQVREEPEKIKIWKEQQKTRLEVKDAEEEENKLKLREAAKKELEEWYKNYDEQISKTRNTNRSAEQDGAAAASSPVEEGKEWERIADLCDFNPKSTKQQKDISRMRSLILKLKQNPPTSRRQSSASNGTS